MKTIALLTALAVILVDINGPKGSVGGSLAMGFVLIVAMFAVGIYEAWTQRRGVVGWIVNIVASFVGGLVVASVMPIFLVPLMLIFQLDGTSLASSQDSAKYIVYAVTAGLTVYGVWLILQLVNRFRTAPAQRNERSV